MSDEHDSVVKRYEALTGPDGVPRVTDHGGEVDYTTAICGKAEDAERIARLLNDDTGAVDVLREIAEFGPGYGDLSPVAARMRAKAKAALDAIGRQ